MKKLGVSIFALLVATPMVARADLSPVVTNNYTGPENQVASTSYVKGAYDAIAGEINTVITQVNTNTNAIADKQAQLQNNAGTPVDIDSSVLTSVRADGTADDTHLVTEKAVRDAIGTATSSSVTADSTTTFTNKTFDATATGNSITNLGTGNFASGTVVNSTTGIAATATASDSKMVTEKAVASALDDKQDKTDSEVTSAEATAHSLLTAGTAVHTNLASLAGAIEDNQDAIGTIADLTGGETNLVDAIEAVRTTAGSALTASSTATLTNKTIDADDNTIQDLTTTNFKSGTVVTSVRDTTNAQDTSLASEKAVATALAGKQDASKSTVASNGNYIVAGDGVATNLGNLDTQVKANADAIASVTSKQVQVYTQWGTSNTGKANALVDPDPVTP